MIGIERLVIPMYLAPARVTCRPLGEEVAEASGGATRGTKVGVRDACDDRRRLKLCSTSRT